nr:replication factor A protein 1-like [Ipomoea batatas]GMD25704.1 replication factor A protein 1-like [Ipomoea batatas]GME21547.1 replication factor A protein 1-like [Ipomoea batatas]
MKGMRLGLEWTEMGQSRRQRRRRRKRWPRARLAQRQAGLRFSDLSASLSPTFFFSCLKAAFGCCYVAARATSDRATKDAYDPDAENCQLYASLLRRRVNRITAVFTIKIHVDIPPELETLIGMAMLFKIGFKKDQQRGTTSASAFTVIRLDLSQAVEVNSSCSVVLHISVAAKC